METNNKYYYGVPLNIFLCFTQNQINIIVMGYLCFPSPFDLKGNLYINNVILKYSSSS